MNLFGRHPSFTLDKARVIVTGSSSGIGRSLALSLSYKGAQLVLAARRPDALLKTAEVVASVNPDRIPLVVPTDVREEASVTHLIEKTIDCLGGVDVLVNNAGTCIYGSASRMNQTDFESMLAVHLLGPYFAMRAVIPQMKQQGGGVIVNVASVAALYGVPYLSFYGAAKAAQVTLSQSLRSELHGTGIRILTVCPGNTRTPLFEVEKKVGGARRPGGPYRSADGVAASIVKAIEDGDEHLVLSIEGKLLHLARSVAPGVVQSFFNLMAERLQEDFHHA
jgi:short-subunit dehydrogenase